MLLVRSRSVGSVRTLSADNPVVDAVIIRKESAVGEDETYTLDLAPRHLKPERGTATPPKPKGLMAKLFPSIATLASLNASSSVCCMMLSTG